MCVSSLKSHVGKSFRDQTLIRICVIAELIYCLIYHWIDCASCISHVLHLHCTIIVFCLLILTQTYLTASLHLPTKRHSVNLLTHYGTAILLHQKHFTTLESLPYTLPLPPQSSDYRLSITPFLSCRIHVHDLTNQYLDDYNAIIR